MEFASRRNLCVDIAGATPSHLSAACRLFSVPRREAEYARIRCMLPVLERGGAGMYRDRGCTVPP